ncbi:MAG: hypothetical protein E7214_10125 [Clostridium sp.]|nr:hypothetical protein [Clostridium sp.]
MNRKAIDVAKEKEMYLKVVVSTAPFDNYNSFFNIYGEEDKPCRRIVVLTPYKDLEEVSEVNAGTAIVTDRLINNNLWLAEFPLTTLPSKIELDKIIISEEQYKLL